MFDNATLLVPDNSVEQNFRTWPKALSAALAAAGFVKTNDTGQINLDASLVSAFSFDSAYPPVNAFDNSTATLWRSGAAPTVNAPQWLMYDAGVAGGVGQTFTPASWGLYTSGAAADALNVTLQSASATSGPWSDVDTRTLSSIAGMQSWNINPAAARYWRILVNSTQGTSTYVQLAEFQLWTGANLTGTRAVPTAMRPTAANTAVGYEVWRFNDTLQGTTPVFFKVEYGSGTLATYPGLWLTIGNGSDGAGNLTGAGLTARQAIVGTSSSFTTTRNAFSGAAGAGSEGRGTFALFYNSAAFLWFALERIRKDDGTPGDFGVYAAFGSGASKGHLVCPKSGPAPTTETDYACLAPTQGTGLRAPDVSVYCVAPFLARPLNPMISIFGYFEANFTAETASSVGVYGTNRNVFFLGNNPTAIGRGNAATRLAMLAE